MRFQTCVEICQRYKPQIAIETGTFYGTTTVALSSLVSEQTFTIELNQEYANLAATYFRAKGFDDNRIKLIRGNSETEIVNVLSQVSRDSRIFVYLDAHWGQKLPIQDELSALINWGGAFVAVNDDFEVGGGSNFGFDSYNGINLDLSLIPKNFLGTIYLPNHLALQEYGARRGTCYLFSAKALEFIPELSFTNLTQIQK